jgi:hypothetical protein
MSSEAALSRQRGFLNGSIRKVCLGTGTRRTPPAISAARLESQCKAESTVQRKGCSVDGVSLLRLAPRSPCRSARNPRSRMTGGRTNDAFQSRDNWAVSRGPLNSPRKRSGCVGSEECVLRIKSGDMSCPCILLLFIVHRLRSHARISSGSRTRMSCFKT